MIFNDEELFFLFSLAMKQLSIKQQKNRMLSKFFLSLVFLFLSYFRHNYLNLMVFNLVPGTPPSILLCT